MAVCIVEVLEIIDIQQQQAQRVSVTVETFDLPFELAVKMPGIEQLGEAIGNGEFFQLLQHLDPFLVETTLVEHSLQTQQQFFEAYRLEDKVTGPFADSLFV